MIGSAFEIYGEKLLSFIVSVEMLKEFEMLEEFEILEEFSYAIVQHCKEERFVRRGRDCVALNYKLWSEVLVFEQMTDCEEVELSTIILVELQMWEE